MIAVMISICSRSIYISAVYSERVSDMYSIARSVTARDDIAAVDYHVAAVRPDAAGLTYRCE